jgi:peroxiredoxin
VSASLRPLLLVAAVVVVGAAGVYVGRTLRTQNPPAGTIPVPTSLLETGEEFPEVGLRDENGDSTSSLDAVPGGGVVLFLDLDCPPCAEMAQRWQRARDGGVIEAGAVCAVTYHRADAVREFKAGHGLTFPFYRDSLMVFRNQYRVDRFPLEVVVGRSGRIRSTSYDSESPIDPVTLHRQLEN